MISNLLTALNERFMPFATFRHAVGKALPIRWQNTISGTKLSPAASPLP